MVIMPPDGTAVTRENPQAPPDSSHFLSKDSVKNAFLGNTSSKK
jgi:hypothetical protein